MSFGASQGQIKYTLVIDDSAVTNKLNTFKTNLKTLDTATKSSATNIKAANDQLKQTDITSTSLSAKLKGLGSNFNTLAIGIGATATSVISLWRNYRDLEDTNIAVDRTTRKLSLAQEAQIKAQEKVNELIRAGKKGTPEYEQALLDLDQANQAVSIATDMHGEALERQSDTYQNFYMSIIPSAIGVVSSLVGTLGILRKNSDNVTQAVGGNITGFARMGGLLKSGGPLLLGIGAVAAGFMAIRTNAFGVRDFLDEMGASIGKAIPQLKDFVMWVKDFGSAIGLTGGDVDFSKAWDLLVSGFNTAIEKIKTTDWKTVIDNIGTQIENAINNFDWDTAWKSFKDALYSTGVWVWEKMGQIGERIIKYIYANKDKWWQGFIDGLNGIGSLIVTRLNEEVGKVGTQLAKTGGDIWTKITEGFAGIGKSIWDLFGFKDVYADSGMPSFQLPVDFDIPVKKNPYENLIKLIHTSFAQLQGNIEAIFNEIAGYKVKTRSNPFDKFIANMNKSFEQFYKSAIGILNDITSYKIKVKNNPYEKYISNIIKSFEQMQKKVEDIMNDLPTKHTIEIQQKFTTTGKKLFATGGAFITNGTTEIDGRIMGEAGPELVTITPLSNRNSKVGVEIPQSLAGGGGPIQITLNINGNDIIESRKIVKLIRDVTGRNTSRHT